MPISLEKVISQNFGESGTKSQNIKTSKVQTDNDIKSMQHEKLTLPEIKLHLDDILKETQIKYSLDESEDSFIIKVMDKKTDKIIKEIPSHDIQVLRKHFKDHLGVIFNQLI